MSASGVTPAVLQFLSRQEHYCIEDSIAKSLGELTGLHRWVRAFGGGKGICRIRHAQAES